MKNETITAPKGFLAASVSCGVKESVKKDLGLIVCPAGAKAAAVFTTNNIVSAAVTICREHVKSAQVEAVVVNSGNANACTGQKGIQDAIAMCRETAKQIEAKPGKVLVASTGIIGQALPIGKVKAGIAQAVKKLKANAASGRGFARAIMTTDTKPKQTFSEIKISGRKVLLAGTVKGAGMIAPDMATTLCFITTDVAIRKSLLAKTLKDAIGGSLNKLTVDGHQSTNDTAIILASGLAGNRPIEKKDSQYAKFAKALSNLCSELTKQMALDAEGATRMFTVVVKSAATKADAAKACRAVADYSLVKCAVNGADPNWGRIICAVGSCGAKVKLEKVGCKIGDVTVFRNGQPVKFDVKKASRIVSQKEHTITIELGAGKYSDFCYGCDLSSEYVAINADYHT